MSIPAKKVLFTSHTANFHKFNRPFMRWFKEQGYEVHYASAGEEEVLDCDQHFTVPFERSPFKLGNLRAYKELKKIIDKEEYDIIHTHTPMGSVVTRLAALNARKKGTRVIYTAHGFHFFKGASLKSWAIYYPIERIMAFYTDTLITVNGEDYGVAKNKFKTDVRHIPGVGVNLHTFSPLSQDAKLILRSKYGFDRDDFILIYAAELNINKNQAFLIKQIKEMRIKIPTVKLLLCGEGDLKSEYEYLIEKFQLQDQVKLLGYRKDINELFQIADVCVASSIREGFGLNLVEAMAVGLPIVATANRGHNEIIQHGENGYLYDSNHLHDFHRYIESLYNNKTKVNTISKNNIANVKKYSLHESVKLMGAIYGE